MQSLEFLLKWVSRLLLAVAALSLLLMMVHVTVDVIAYNVFRRPISGTAEIVAYHYMVAAVFLPLPLVELRNASIHVDLFFNLSGPQARRLMLVLAYLVQTVFFAALAWRSGNDAMMAYSRGEVVFGQIIVPIWPGRFFLPAGFGVAALVSVLQFAKAIMRPGWDPNHDDDADFADETVRGGPDGTP